MPRTLLTGGSGFIATHVLEALLKSGHSVVTTVRTQEKADHIAASYSQYPKSQLSFSLVPDIAAEGAFDKAVISDPPFDTVIHTASPFHFNTTDSQKDLLDPAINGTKGILTAIKRSAPSVKRVVVTSSFAAIVSADGKPAGYAYSEKDWNPVTKEQAVQNASLGYRASKTFAEKAAWEFVESEKPNFTLATMNPPLVFGPVTNNQTLGSLNTSNELLRDLIQGKYKDKGVPRAGVFFWVDVRDLAEAHVKAAEVEEAGGKRFFVTAGDYSNEEIARTIREKFPEYKDQIPEDLSGAGYGDGRPKADNKRSVEILGIKYRGIEACVVDTVKSLKNVPE